MKVILIFLTLAMGLCAAARRTTTTTSTVPTFEGRQIGHRGQRQENVWDLIELQKVDDHADFWNKNPTAPVNTTEPEDSIIVIERQNYPLLPVPGDTNELPEPIVTIKPENPPPGCYALRGQFPSPKNCANYLNCWDGVVIEQTCPDGLLFNAITLVCDYDYNVNCGDRPLPPPKAPLPTGSKLCPDPNGRYRSATNCSEFYVCVFGTPIKFSCPRGLVYNDVLSVCDYPYNVDCKGAATPRPPIPTLPPITLPTSPPSQPQTYEPLPPSLPPQPSLPPSPPPQPPSYPNNPWLSSRLDTDPWHQRPVASQFELDQQGGGGQDQSTPGEIQNPWNMVQNIPASLVGVPCKNGDIHRLNDGCTNVVVCRNNRPQLVQCSTGLTYDRPSDSCKPFSVAKC